MKNVYDLTKYIYPQKWDFKKLRKARKKSFLFLLISKFFPIPFKKRELLKNQQFFFYVLKIFKPKPNDKQKKNF